MRVSRRSTPTAPASFFLFTAMIAVKFTSTATGVRIYGTSIACRITRANEVTSGTPAGQSNGAAHDQEQSQ
ncbi:hypothetical protein PGT21_009889 [Puccinia graminis f. sp. tritici]|uniref:Secreted protein n=1 Tax=Puccinia graminis f. sp. tritici TaxID=56615 RepID=A0A5B0PFD6_PUCGR|nr:hypothetical protein PGT21_009889 [Puccinia graminis f. sp. tritici]